MSSIANLHAAALGLRDCYTFAADPRVLPGAIVWKVLLVVVFSRAFALLRIFLLIAALFSFNSLLTPTTAGFAQSTVPDQYDVSHLAGGPGGAGYLDGTGLQARFNGPTGLWGTSGNLYVADSGERTIRKIVAATGEVSTIARLDASLECTGSPS